MDKKNYCEYCLYILKQKMICDYRHIESDDHKEITRHYYMMCNLFFSYISKINEEEINSAKYNEISKLLQELIYNEPWLKIKFNSFMY